MNPSATQPERGASGKLASLGRLHFSVPREAHIWIILAIMACGTLLYYADSIPWIETVESTLRLDFTRRSIHRILSILPVAYAAAVFGLQGGLLASFVIGALLLPRVFVVSSEPHDALVEVVAFVFIGAFVSWLIDIQLKEKSRHGQTITSLERTQEELQAHIELGRQTAEQLRQSEESYRGLFENATEAIFVLDLRGKIIAANRACEKLTGLTSAELVGMQSGSFLSGESLATVAEVVEKQVRGETNEGPIELRLTRRDGTQAVVELMPNVIVQDDEPVGLQAIMRDVTEQRRLQENLRFYVSQVLRAQEAERLRIARELHDDTAQALTGLSRRLDMLVDTLASSGDQVPREISERLEELRDQSDTILEGVRRFSRDLRPPVLDDLGLLPALKWLVTGLEEEHGIAADVRVVGEQRRLPTETELAVFRIAQEALNNVWKHSGASAVELSLDFRGHALTLAVADNGKGFDVPRSVSDLAANGKLGVIGMEERVRILGGTLSLRSEPGAGTCVIVTVPV
jgi:two-component system sensor histidine kinase DegS